jgi:hypothetical protein
VPTADELRAEQWQRDRARQSALNAEREAALHGSESARHALEVGWDPFVQWRAEIHDQTPPSLDEGY